MVQCNDLVITCDTERSDGHVNFAAKEVKPANRKVASPGLRSPAGRPKSRISQEDSNLNSDFENYLVVNPAKYEWQNWMFVRRRRIGVVSTFAGRHFRSRFSCKIVKDAKQLPVSALALDMSISENSENFRDFGLNQDLLNQGFK